MDKVRTIQQEIHLYLFTVENLYPPEDLSSFFVIK